jgi:hypothetical protein
MILICPLENLRESRNLDKLKSESFSGIEETKPDNTKVSGGAILTVSVSFIGIRSLPLFPDLKFLIRLSGTNSEIEGNP